MNETGTAARALINPIESEQKAETQIRRPSFRLISGLENTVAKDNTVRYQGTILQIPQDPHRFHDVKVTVRVHAYPDGTLAVFHGPRCLARYHADGQLIETEAESRRRKDPIPRSSARPIVDPRATVRDIMSARG